MAEPVAIEVVLVLPGQARRRHLRMPAGATVAQAVAAAGLTEDGAPWDLQRVGIFGRLVAPEHVLSDGDRLELYRPLLTDPKEARRRRARS